MKGPILAVTCFCFIGAVLLRAPYCIVPRQKQAPEAFCKKGILKNIHMETTALLSEDLQFY